MASKRGGKNRIDLASIAGVMLALGGILGGLILEGGKLSDVTQLTAGLIVIAGTLGAVMVTTPMSVLGGAAKKLTLVFFEPVHSPGDSIAEILAYAQKARKSGIVSLEGDVERIQDPFLAKALRLAVDGTDLQDLKKMMELELSEEEHHGEAEAKVYESAGGYAPTIGIIGAVLGLIQVMKHLEDIKEVGHGIAVAFVATVYGVAIANLFFLPAANKLKARLQNEIRSKELLLEGVVSIVEGMNPKLIQSKLEAYVRDGGKATQASGREREQLSRTVAVEG